MSFSAHKQ